jgi:hypothetical protein
MQIDVIAVCVRALSINLDEILHQYYSHKNGLTRKDKQKGERRKHFQRPKPEEHEDMPQH